MTASRHLFLITLLFGSTVTGAWAVGGPGTHNTTIRGANVHADEQLTLDVGENLFVESKQNRSRSSGNSVGISGGFGFGESGNMTSVNAGMRGSNSRARSKETVLTSLTSGGSAEINVGEHTQVTGALIATVDDEGNDLGNLRRTEGRRIGISVTSDRLTLRTGTFDYADLENTHYSSEQSAGISTSIGLGGAEAGDPAKQNATDAGGESDLRLNTSNIQYSNASHYEKGKTLATLGQGVVEIRDEEGSGDISRLNRDTGGTEKELFEVDRQKGNIDLTVDHRLLNKEGREQIKNQTKQVAKAAGKAATMVGREVQTWVRDLPEDLNQELGETGERMLDACIHAQGGGCNLEQALLEDRSLREDVATLDEVNELLALRNQLGMRAVSGDQAASDQLQKDFIDSKTSGNIASKISAQGGGYADGGSFQGVEEVTVTGLPSPESLIQQGVRALGNIQGRIDTLAASNPEAAANLGRLVSVAMGGPLKAAGQEMVMTALQKSPLGEQIERFDQTVVDYGGAWVARDESVDAYREDVELEQARPDLDCQERSVYGNGVRFLKDYVVGIGAPGRKGSHKQDNSHQSAPKGEVSDGVAKGSLYERGKFRKDADKKALDEAPRNANGDMQCPTCGNDIPEKITQNTKNGPRERRGYDLDHYPDTWKERVNKMKKQDPSPTRKEVLDEYNRDLRVQCPECNQSHRFEGVEGAYKGVKIDD